jgi:hypothetical protein
MTKGKKGNHKPIGTANCRNNKPKIHKPDTDDATKCD